MNFSVLLSVYHREIADNLENSLNSIIDQTLLPNEIVLVKDGPLNDELDRVIENFQLAYPTLFKIVALNKNFGLGNALRFGVEHCSYDIIARMDTDDIARPERFERQINFLIRNPDIGVIGSNMEEFDKVPGDLKRFKVNPEEHDDLIKAIKLRNPFNHPSTMMRKEALLNAGNYNGDILLFEDYSLFLKMWKVGVKFYNIQEVLLDFRVGDGLETIKRRSGIHYLEKERLFLKYAKSIGAFTSWDVLKYKLLKFPVRVMPPKLVLLIYNTFLRTKV